MQQLTYWQLFQQWVMQDPLREALVYGYVTFVVLVAVFLIIGLVVRIVRP